MTVAPVDQVDRVRRSHQATAHLSGTITGTSGRTETYAERLFLGRDDERWYLKMISSDPEGL